MAEEYGDAGEAAVAGLTEGTMGAVGALTEYWRAGMSLRDMFWVGGWVLIGLYLGTIIFGWWADVSEEEGADRSAKWLIAGLGIWAVAIIGMVKAIYDGLLLPYLAVGYVYVRRTTDEGGSKQLTYSTIAWITVVSISSIVVPGFWDILGAFNWRNWGDWLGGDYGGCGIRSSFFGDWQSYVGWLGTLGSGLLGIDVGAFA